MEIIKVFYQKCNQKDVQIRWTTSSTHPNQEDSGVSVIINKCVSFSIVAVMVVKMHTMRSFAKFNLATLHWRRLSCFSNYRSIVCSKPPGLVQRPQSYRSEFLTTTWHILRKCRFTLWFAERRWSWKFRRRGGILLSPVRDVSFALPFSCSTHAPNIVYDVPFCPICVFLYCFNLTCDTVGMPPVFSIKGRYYTQEVLYNCKSDIEGTDSAQRNTIVATRSQAAISC